MLLSGHITTTGEFLLKLGPEQQLLSGTDFLGKLIDVEADVTIVIVDGCFAEGFFDNYGDVQEHKGRKDGLFSFLKSNPQKETRGQVPTGPSRVDAFQHDIIVICSCNRAQEVKCCNPKGNSEVFNSIFTKYFLNGLEGASCCFRPSSVKPGLRESQEPCSVCSNFREGRAERGWVDVLDVINYAHRHIEQDRQEFVQLPLPIVKVKGIAGINRSRIILPLKQAKHRN